MLLRLAAPIYVELLTAVVAVSVIDLLWVSGLGPSAIAAVTIATTVEYLLYGLFLAVPTGLTVLIGRNDAHAGDAGGSISPIRPLVRTGWLATIVIGTSIAALALPLRHHLSALLAPDPATAALTAGFLAVSLAGLPVYFAQTCVDAVAKGRGNTKLPMRNALICNALVIVLDPLFIYVLDLGVQGAALATVLARAITLLIALTARLTPRDGAGWASPWPILRTGLPMSGDFLSRSVVGLVMVDLVAAFGLSAQAGYGIGLKIMLAGVMAFYAVRQATMIATARSEPLPSPAKIGLVTGAVVALVLNLVASPAASWFTGDPAVAEQAVAFLRWMPLYLLPFATLLAVGGVLQASGRGARLLAATLAGFAVQLPAAYLLSGWIGVTGLWLAMAAGAAVSLAGSGSGSAVRAIARR
ncbi:MATE family efflux transporter [Nonomuraea soli]|uniref:Probable multidrug resistance protein NorM n=1 Tax=Nonomuraea soli TaxID=1032476 RepID=A0A7W0CMR4_9ACTN|nr:MATE family efflux transporter [Nonomuraea soli]MBA2894021.1 putative MATE family efflux protein [Nonomuraea soli]